MQRLVLALVLMAGCACAVLPHSRAELQSLASREARLRLPAEQQLQTLQRSTENQSGAAASSAASSATAADAATAEGSWLRVPQKLLLLLLEQKQQQQQQHQEQRQQQQFPQGGSGRSAEEPGNIESDANVVDSVDDDNGDDDVISGVIPRSSSRSLSRRSLGSKKPKSPKKGKSPKSPKPPKSPKSPKTPKPPPPQDDSGTGDGEGGWGPGGDGPFEDTPSLSPPPPSPPPPSESTPATPPISPGSPWLFDVRDSGATGDGTTDDTQAVLSAFSAACSYAPPSSSAPPPTLYFPRGFTFYMFPLRLNGPCTSSQGVTIQLDGTILAELDMEHYPESNSSSYALLYVNKVFRLKVRGSGAIDGQGMEWWSVARDKTLRPNMPRRPDGLYITKCDDFLVEGITIRNPAKTHLNIYDCVLGVVQWVTTDSPYNSPNTDSIHLSESDRITVRNVYLSGGDDNFSIEDGCSNIDIRNVTAISGHGISIGSLGHDGTLACVANITVVGAQLTALQQGLRIKTYAGGHGSVENVAFENIVLTSVSRPLVLDQYYCDGGCFDSPFNVAIKGLSLRNIRGTTNGTAVIFNCSSTAPCTDVRMESVALTSLRNRPKPNTYNAVFGSTSGVSPVVAEGIGSNLDGVSEPSTEQAELLEGLYAECRGNLPRRPIRTR